MTEKNNGSHGANDTDASAPGGLSQQLYADLHQIAARLMAGEQAGHTLQVTALVNEAWLRLNQNKDLQAADKQHLKAMAARQMRHALIDHARHKKSKRSPYSRLRISLSNKELTIDEAEQENMLDFLDLCQSLEELNTLNSRHCQVFELRYFGGQTVPECASYLGVSERTVKLDWQFATAWLAQRLDLHRPSQLSDRSNR